MALPSRSQSGERSNYKRGLMLSTQPAGRDPLNRDEQNVVLLGLFGALEDYVDTVDLILTRGPGLVNHASFEESSAWSSMPEMPTATSMIWAVCLDTALNFREMKTLGFCSWLIDHGADVNPRQHPDEMTPLERHYCQVSVEQRREEGHLQRNIDCFVHSVMVGEVMRAVNSKGGGGGLFCSGQASGKSYICFAAEIFGKSRYNFPQVWQDHSEYLHTSMLFPLL